MTISRLLVAALIGIAGSTFSTTALAVRSKICPYCSAATMQANARAAGLGEFYVWDPYANGLMRKYFTYCGNPRSADAVGKSFIQSPAGGICGTAPMITEEVPVEAQYLELAPHLAVLYIASNGTFHFGADLNPPGRSVATPDAVFTEPRGLEVDLRGQTWETYYPLQPSATDYFTDANLRGQVKDYIYRNGMSAVTTDFCGSRWSSWLPMSMPCRRSRRAWS